MSGKRERKIIEGFLVACIASAVASFVLIVLPNQLRKAGAVTPQHPAAAAPANLSSIIPLHTAAPPPTPREVRRGLIARFVPEGTPAADDAPAPAASARRVDADDLGAAGGAGAAIDDLSAESRLALDHRYDAPPERAASALPPPAAPSALTSLPSGPLSESRAMRASSLALRGTRAAPPSTPAPAWLAIPPGLESDVAFWRDIYAKYDRNQVVLHHPRYLGIIYDVVDLSDIAADPRLNGIERARMRDDRIDERRQEIVAILRKLATHPQASSLSDEEWRIRKLFAAVQEPDAFRRAAEEDGVRAQLGQRDKFMAGLPYAGRYLGEIESIFESYGLPRELTFIIFVESMFNPQARSSVGASGIWQFMRETGKLYLQVNDLIDERNDPIAATHAAAKLLRQNYEVLGSWPLAINAYNAGRGRLQQAVSQLGTNDIARIIREFSHPAYGFASRNFFLEFLAAYDVAEHAEQYFGTIAYDAPLRFEVVRAPYHLSLPDVARIAGIPIEQLAELNLAFNDCLIEGRRLLPAGTEIRVPERKGQIFLAAAARAPSSKSGPLSHVVREGETMVSIAGMYGVTPAQILKANRHVGRSLTAGQSLMIPTTGGK